MQEIRQTRRDVQQCACSIQLARPRCEDANAPKAQMDGRGGEQKSKGWGQGLWVSSIASPHYQSSYPVLEDALVRRLGVRGQAYYDHGWPL